MWVPGGVAYWIAITAVWFKWAHRERGDDEPAVIPPMPNLVSAGPRAST